MYSYACTVKRVIDGDTVVVDIDQGFYSWLHDQHIRLLSYDAPEMSDPRGQAAKDALAYMMPVGRSFRVDTVKYGAHDKYGRWLGTFWDQDDRSVNQRMIDGGFVK